VARTSLVEPDVAAGAALVQALDEAGLDVRAAFWFLIPELGVWRLFLALPSVATEGRRAAYERIQRIIREMDDEPPRLDDVSVVPPDNEIAKLLRSAVQTGPELASIRFSSNTVNGVFVEDAFIYRLV
jgi:hypothetical protein